MKENQESWDLFICHASEDKEEIVRPLVKALVNAGLTVWYDEFTLAIGDHLRRSIDKGLAKSKYGVIILSPNFFEKNWPQTELDGLTAKERNGEKVILPVWHKVNEQFVRRYSPTLADRVAVSTEKGIDSVVREILNAIKLPETKSQEKDNLKPVRSRLESAIRSLRGRYPYEILRMISRSDYEKIKQTFTDILNGIAFYDLPQSVFDNSLFSFIESAILERNEREGTELFRILLDWYFQTVTPHARVETLKTFAKLTRLSFIKKVILEAGKASSFVAEFGLSDSFEIAGVNSEILMNIQTLLSDTDLNRFVDYSLKNDQILSSWSAKRYLVKILNLCERRIPSAKTQQLGRLLSH